MKYETLKKLVKENSNAKIHINSTGNGLVTVIQNDQIAYFNMTYQGNIGVSKAEVLKRLARLTTTNSSRGITQ
jgi:hypothetical protein